MCGLFPFFIEQIQTNLILQQLSHQRNLFRYLLKIPRDMDFSIIIFTLSNIRYKAFSRFSLSSIDLSLFTVEARIFRIFRALYKYSTFPRSISKIRAFLRLQRVKTVFNFERNVSACFFLTREIHRRQNCTNIVMAE